MHKIFTSLYFKYAVVVSSMSLLVILMIYLIVVNKELSDNHTSLIVATHEIKLNTALAHLNINEINSNNFNHNYVEIVSNIDNALWYTNAMLLGGSKDELDIKSLKDANLQENVIKLKKQLTLFKLTVLDRLNADLQFAESQKQAQEQINLYKDTLVQVLQVQNEIHSFIKAEKKKNFLVELFLFISSSVLFVSTLIILKRSVNKFKNGQAKVEETLKENIRLNKQHRQQNIKLNKILNAYKDGVYLSSESCEIQFLNKAMIEEIGHNAVGEKCYKAINGLDERCSWCYQKNLIDEKHTSIELEREGKNFIVSSSLLNDNSKITVYHDISNIKKIENELQNQVKEYEILNKQLISAKESAEESNLLKTEFLNNMSHEIRTPMNGILGFAELLKNPDLDLDKRNNFITIIKNSGIQLLHIIDDILDISILETKQVKIFEEEICLNDSLLELFSIFDLKAKENKTPLFFKKELSDEQSTILIDNTKLNKVLSNLLENALKFTSEGFIELGYYIENKGETPNLVIYVKDTGIGISSDDYTLIFDRFSQAEKQPLNNAGGLGLGLSIAKENTELLGGTISVKSIKGKGSTFFISIPYNPVNHKTVDLSNNHENAPVILIAEDEEVNFIYLETLLTDILHIDCKILHAKNGQEAVDICKQNETVQIVLMDIKMPLMCGCEATRQIRAFKPDLPIIAQTAFSTQEDINKTLGSGCNEVLSKPINKTEFKDVIDRYLNVLA